ncbi:MAG: hypothetical protein JJLCMIEE_03095 [Acidimicrobiales bacterium]|nr:MAG: hypothetical protein EDR02_08110 [Actinomycetota bacterium]MBV6509977.1 hypothetical protein [Acidimicrobiales bacterium]RIK08533.1 MAG: hypothetical protein DCC48_00895 [Acidobacteriota bacterium]
MLTLTRIFPELLTEIPHPVGSANEAWGFSLLDVDETVPAARELEFSSVVPGRYLTEVGVA